MTPSGRFATKLLLISLLIPAALRAQNVYDESHSRDFARYLMQSHQFQLAAREWERVLFLNPADTNARLGLVKSLRLGGNPGDGWNRLNAWYPQGPLSRPFALEGAQMALMLQDFSTFSTILERSAGLSASEKSDLELGAWLIAGEWIGKPKQAREPETGFAATNPQLLDLYRKTLGISRKSPAASVALSAVVPGMGKIYSGDWKDGLITLLFVATNAWQSYRGFSKYGVTSVTGWIFGGLTAGFYTANLFGSWKSARDYNLRQTDLIRHETETLLYTR